MESPTVINPANRDSNRTAPVTMGNLEYRKGEETVILQLEGAEAAAGGAGVAEAAAAGPPAQDTPLEPPPAYISHLIENGLVFQDQWDALRPEVQSHLLNIHDLSAALDALVAQHLLTTYQADMIFQGQGHSLILGNYRLLNLIGRGGMGEVYRAEHIYLRNQVAIKLFLDDGEERPELLDRFFFEARAIARLRHPNLVCCTDAGRELSSRPHGPKRHFYVMELVAGTDLDKVVLTHGPLKVAQAARVFKQVAEALSEAHRIGLIHRDVKPSNIMVTPECAAKLLDFGLVHHSTGVMAAPGVLLGTIDYMAPEQASNPDQVDGRADVFSLGAALFTTLTGKVPFRPSRSPFATLQLRLKAPPPRIRDLNPDLPPCLDSLVASMMEPNPELRLPSAAAAASALIPYIQRRSEKLTEGMADRLLPRVLVIDDDEDVRVLIRAVLEHDCLVSEAANGQAGLDAVTAVDFSLVVVDQEMPNVDGIEFITRLDRDGIGGRPKVLFMSGHLPVECLGGLLLAGADDFIQKPFTVNEFLSRVRGLLKRHQSDISRSGVE